MPPRETLLAMIERGMTTKQIAAHFNRSINSVCMWKSQYGLLGLRPGGAQRKRLDVDALRSLVGTGANMETIARHFECSIDTVKRNLAENGLQTRRQVGLSGERDFKPAVADVAPSVVALRFAHPFGNNYSTRGGA